MNAPALRPELKTLIWPHSEEEFFAHYWEKKHFFVAGGAERLEHLRRGFGGFEPADPRLKPWYDAYTGSFSPVPNRSVVTAFCSPGGHGTSMHFDRQDVFNVQLTGRKTWRVAPNPKLPNTLHDWQIDQTVSR